MLVPQAANASEKTAHRKWRVIKDGESDAEWNMAVDEAVFDAVCANSQPPTLRLYRWMGPAITLGRFQSVDRTIDSFACDRLGIPLVRRVTGGRGILHGNDLTVSLVASLSALGLSALTPSVGNIYRSSAKLFIRAFKRLGIDATMGGAGRIRGQDRMGNCFDIVSHGDIVELQTGRKLIGAALYRRGEFVLLQASIPLGGPAELMGCSDVFRSVLFRTNEDANVREPVRLSAFDLGDALIDAIDASDNVTIETNLLSVTEVECARTLVRERYGVLQWNRHGVNDHNDQGSAQLTAG